MDLIPVHPSCFQYSLAFAVRQSNVHGNNQALELGWFEKEKIWLPNMSLNFRSQGGMVPSRCSPELEKAEETMTKTPKSSFLQQEVENWECTGGQIIILVSVPLVLGKSVTAP
ncbi:hypothetical protein GQ457_06G020350 [Hibiscus cannabinus]